MPAEAAASVRFSVAKSKRNIVKFKQTMLKKHNTLRCISTGILLDFLIPCKFDL